MADHPKNYWTLERCKEEALKFQTRTEWKKNGRAYSAACRKEWLEECCSHMTANHVPYGYWTLETCKEEAAKYKNRKEWTKNSPGSHSTAYARGWAAECTLHMETLGNQMRRKLYAFEYPDKSVYVGLTQDYDRRYYQHMNNNKVLIEKNKLGGQKFIKFDTFYPTDKVGIEEGKLIEKYRFEGWTILNKAKPGGIGGATLRWTADLCKIEALKYNSRVEWIKSDGGSYDSARRQGILEECCSHMERLVSKPFDKKCCKNEALKHKTKNEWRKAHSGSYARAWSKGWLKECTSHMENLRNLKWTKEKVLAEAKKYKNAKELIQFSSGAYYRAQEDGYLEELKYA